MGILAQELRTSSDPDDRAALLREIDTERASAYGSHSSTEVNIGHQTINTQATDARGIASDWHDATFDAASQANSGIKP